VARRTIEYKVATRDLKAFSSTHSGHALLSPCAGTIHSSRRSLQHVREKMRPQLEYPPLFLVPVTDGAMFLTGDGTSINDHYFSVDSTITVALYTTGIETSKISYYACLSHLT
jgi:hypothetical protein